jgi:hypothetical protein
MKFSASTSMTIAHALKSGRFWNENTGFRRSQHIPMFPVLHIELYKETDGSLSLARININTEYIESGS